MSNASDSSREEARASAADFGTRLRQMVEQAEQDAEQATASVQASDAWPTSRIGLDLREPAKAALYRCKALYEVLEEYENDPHERFAIAQRKTDALMRWLVRLNG